MSDALDPASGPKTPGEWGDALVDEQDETQALALESQLIEQTDNGAQPEDPADQPEDAG